MLLNEKYGIFIKGEADITFHRDVTLIILISRFYVCFHNNKCLRCDLTQ